MIPRRETVIKGTHMEGETLKMMGDFPVEKVDTNEIDCPINVGGLAKAILPFSARPKLLAMIVVYFDESGTQDGSSGVSFGGYISSEKRWERFQKQWSKTLDSFGVEYFHMSQFESRFGPYKNWTQAKRVDFLTKLIRVIHGNTMVPISSAAIIDGYEEIKRRFGPGISPYGFCLVESLKSVASWAHSVNQREPIACVLEAGAGFGNEVEAVRKSIFGYDNRREYYCLGSITFADKKRLNPLQAADFLAYESYKEVDNFFAGRRRRRVRKSFAELLKRQNVTFLRYYNREHYLSGTIGNIFGGSS